MQAGKVLVCTATRENEGFLVQTVTGARAGAFMQAGEVVVEVSGGTQP